MNKNFKKKCRIFGQSFSQIAHFKDRLWAIRSHLSLQKSDREWFTHVALYKRANCSRHSLKKSNVSNLLLIQANWLQKMRDLHKKFIFLYVFDWFSPFYAQEGIAHDALCSFAICSKNRWAIPNPGIHKYVIQLITALEIFHYSFFHINISK